jgi:hypothetical protein
MGAIEEQRPSVHPQGALLPQIGQARRAVCAAGAAAADEGPFDPRTMTWWRLPTEGSERMEAHPTAAGGASEAA